MNLDGLFALICVVPSTAAAFLARTALSQKLEFGIWTRDHQKRFPYLALGPSGNHYSIPISASGVSSHPANASTAKPSDILKAGEEFPNAVMVPCTQSMDPTISEHPPALPDRTFCQPDAGKGISDADGQGSVGLGSSRPWSDLAGSEKSICIALVHPRQSSSWHLDLICHVLPGPNSGLSSNPVYPFTFTQRLVSLSESATHNDSDRLIGLAFRTYHVRPS